MIICPTCNAENESHYKFCLACGTELSTVANPQLVENEASKDNASLKDETDAPLKSKLDELRQKKKSETPGLIPSIASQERTAEPDEASFESVLNIHDQDATNVEHLPSVMEADGFPSENGGLYGVSAESAGPPPGHSTDAQGLGGYDTVRLSEELKSVPTDIPKEIKPKKSRKVAPAVGAVICTNCGTEVAAGFRFCGACGTPMTTDDQPTTATNLEQIGELVFIHPNGEEGERLPLCGTQIILGRGSEYGILRSDPHLSPEHVMLTYEDEKLYCEDLESFNGIYTRLIDETVLEHGGMFRIGQQLFRFEEQASRQPDLLSPEADAIPFGSPSNSVWGRLSSVCGPEVYADQWILKTPEIYLGREKGTLTFPDDVFVSGTHCRLKHRDRVCLIEDLGSTNGTYIKRAGRFRLRAKDFILLGQQLFRVELEG